MELYVKMTFNSTFSLFFLVFKRDFIKRADFTRISASEQVMTSQIRSHIEYLIQTYYILVLIF